MVPARLLFSSFSSVTLLLETVTPGQAPIFWVAPAAPHVRKPAFHLTYSFPVAPAKALKMATTARQSSAKSLLLPVTLGLAVRSTKVPSVQLAVASVESLLSWHWIGSYPLEAGYWKREMLRNAVGTAPESLLPQKPMAVRAPVPEVARLATCAGMEPVRLLL